MNRISSIIKKRMDELDKTEYRLCKEAGIIQQSFNKSLKSENSWNSAIALFKICRVLGLDPAALILEEKTGNTEKRITRLIKDNEELKAKYKIEKQNNIKLNKALKLLKDLK